MDPMTRIAELLARLAELTEDELTELDTLIDETWAAKDNDDAPATAETLADLDILLGGMEAVTTERTARSERAEAQAAQRDELRAKREALRNPPKAEAKGDTPDGGAEVTDETPAPTAAEVAEAGAEGETADAGAEQVPVLASGDAPRGSVPGDGMAGRMAAVAGTPAASPTQPSADLGVSPYRAVVTAAAGLPRIGAGAEIGSKTELGRVMADALDRMRTARDNRREVLVASATWEYPEDRRLGDDAAANSAKIEAVTALDADRLDPSTGALVASGGICLPVNVDYAVPTWSTAERPLRDGLPGFQASRGGLRFVTPPDIGVPTLQGGTASGAGVSAGLWNEATDANPAGATKPVWVVPCGSEQLVYVGAVTTRVQFGNMQSRFAPEQVAANTQQAIAVSAREAELNLLTLIANSSKQVKPKQFLGASRDILATLDALRSQYIYSHRIPRTASFTAIFPDWARDVLRADLLREVAHDNAGARDVLAVTDEQIDALFKARNVNVIWTLEGLQAGTYGTGGSAIANQYFPIMPSNAPQPLWPGGQTGGATSSTFTLAWFLYVEGTFQFLDGGQLDLGVVRDSLLDSTNDYETFTEVFEGIAFRGLECYQVQQVIAPTGGSTGTVAATSYVE